MPAGDARRILSHGVFLRVTRWELLSIPRRRHEAAAAQEALGHQGRIIASL
jgi:hypothetical protein